MTSIAHALPQLYLRPGSNLLRYSIPRTGTLAAPVTSSHDPSPTSTLAKVRRWLHIGGGIVSDRPRPVLLGGHSLALTRSRFTDHDGCHGAVRRGVPELTGLSGIPGPAKADYPRGHICSLSVA